MSKVTAAIKKFDRAKTNLQQFCADNNDVMQQYTILVDSYNYALNAVKSELKSVEDPDGFKSGDFRKTKGSSGHKYDPSKLPAELLAIPGVITGVSTSYIDELVEIGKIKEADVKGAREDKNISGKTYAPKELRAI